MFAMGRHGRMVRVAGWLVGGAAMGVGVGVGPLRAQFPPEKLENLKVFPEDIPVRELIGRMGNSRSGWECGVSTVMWVSPGPISRPSIFRPTRR